MRVCHIVPGYYPRVAGPYEYASKLSAEGISVNVLAFGNESEPAEEILDGVQVRRAFIRPINHFSPSNTYKFVSFCLSALRGRHYDIIHVYAFRGCFLLPLLGRGVASRWLLDLRTRNVATSRLISYLANRVTRLESLLFHERVALDQQVGLEVYGTEHLFQVVPLGADFERVKPGRNDELRIDLGIDTDHLVFVFTSTLVPLRCPEKVLQGFAKALEEYPRLFLLVMGDGSMLEPLQVLTSELGIAEKVRFTGYIPLNQVHTYLAAADVGLGYVPMTPQFDPQPPLKTIEFLAAGLPTLATMTRGNALFISHEENGLLVGDDPDALAQGMLRLARDPTLRQKLARNARKSVELYDWQTIVREKLIPVYEQLLGQR